MYNLAESIAFGFYGYVSFAGSSETRGPIESQSIFGS